MLGWALVKIEEYISDRLTGRFARLWRILASLSVLLNILRAYSVTVSGNGNTDCRDEELLRYVLVLPSLHAKV